VVGDDGDFVADGQAGVAADGDFADFFGEAGDGEFGVVADEAEAGGEGGAVGAFVEAEAFAAGVDDEGVGRGRERTVARTARAQRSGGTTPRAIWMLSLKT
jgi:hypothetical protein